MLQKEVAAAFGISRQWTNQYKRKLEKEGMWAVVSLEHKNWKLTEEVVKRIEEILVIDWHATNSQIAKQLVTEGLVEKISEASIRKALRQVDLEQIRQKMRRMIEKGELNQGQISE